MAKDLQTQVNVPRTSRPGDVITVKVRAIHPMEGGRRRDQAGVVIPRDMLSRFTCDFNGLNVVDVGMEPGLSANPYFRFEATVPETGRFVFTWYGEDGSVHTDHADIVVI